MWAFLIVSPVSAQRVLVHGEVRDAETGEVLPSATIQRVGSSSGTIANRDGRFTLSTPIPATLEVRFLGYESQTLLLQEASSDRLIIRLQPIPVLLAEIVISGEDPAVRIMRRVIEEKKRRSAELDRFSAQAYNRFTMENDTGIVSIIESLTNLYWDRARGSREVVLSRRNTANFDVGALFPAALFVKNLYDDDIEVSGFRLMGVTHPDALDAYHFRLVSTRTFDGKTVFDIDVRPRSRLASAFVGSVSVLDEAFVLLRADLKPARAFSMPPPIREMDVVYRQQFRRFADRFWLPVDFEADMDVRVSFGPLLAFPVFRIRQFSRISEYVANGPLPDSLFGAEDYLSVDSTAVEADTLLDLPGIQVPYSSREQAAYVAIDSTLTMDKAYEPTGPLARMVRMQTGPTVASRGLDVSPEFWFNRAEGLHAAVSVGVPITKWLWAHGTVGGRTINPGVLFEVGARVGPSRLGVSSRYRNGVDTRYRSDAGQRFTNLAGILWSGLDYFDYYRNRRLEVGLVSNHRSWDASIMIRREEHASIRGAPVWNLFGETPDPNPAITEGRLGSVALRFEIGPPQPPMGIAVANRALFQIEHAMPGLFDSAFDFTRYRAAADLRIPTFFRRRFLSNSLDLHASGSVARGILPPQRFSIVDASGFISSFGALKTIQNLPREGDAHATLVWEYVFRTVPFEIIGWDAAVRRGWGLILFGGHARTWLSARARNALQFEPRLTEGTQHEIGVSWSGILDLFRVDAAVRLDRPGFALTMGAARLF